MLVLRMSNFTPIYRKVTQKVKTRDFNPVTIHRAVITCRVRNVILDADLADVFGEETKRLNERVKRNAGRFGEKYVFQLTEEEFAGLRSQSATSNPGRGGRRYLPRVFTEHGVVMAATVLNSEKAIEAHRAMAENKLDSFLHVLKELGSSMS
jgi:hypothetical protein